MKYISMVVAALFISSIAFAQDGNIIKLPEPQLGKGKPLMQVLNERKSTRSFSEAEIPIQELANLLWAANGYNRKEQKMRTAPSAMNRQEIDLYVSTRNGLFLYDAKEHALITIHTRDIRALTGSQRFVGNAPVNIILVADLSKIGDQGATGIQTANIDAGYVSENIYLYCASENLATVVRGSVDRQKLAAEMGIGEKQYIVVAQTVGYGN
jgi:SagB-type dehydrogenase family enzyme